MDNYRYNHDTVKFDLAKLFPFKWSTLSDSAAITNLKFLNKL